MGFTSDVASAHLTRSNLWSAQLKDILEVKKTKVDGVVVGKALHEGKISLEEALRMENGV